MNNRDIEFLESLIPTNRDIDSMFRIGDEDNKRDVFRDMFLKEGAHFVAKQIRANMKKALLKG